MALLQLLRTVKHTLWVGRKRARVAGVHVRDAAFRAYDATVPLRFDVDRHRSRRWRELPRMYFLHRDPPAGVDGSRPVPRQVFTIWAGDNPMTPNREAGVASIEAANPEVPVITVTPENLGHFLVDGHPLHPAYEHLSLVHRSDYLRAYLMHHHGGAYSDIKRSHHGFDAAFVRLGSTPDLWLLGYPSVSSNQVGGRDARLGHEIRRRYRSLAGFGAFVCRPGTPLTGEWVREIERRLDYYAEELAEHPGGVWGEEPGYPITWIELGMDVLNPLQLKYLERVGLDPTLQPDLTDHR